MSVYRTDDPLADFDRFEEDRARQLEERPVCSQCDEPIQEDSCFEINDEAICIGCMENFKKHTTDLM